MEARRNETSLVAPESRRARFRRLVGFEAETPEELSDLVNAWYAEDSEREVRSEHFVPVAFQGEEGTRGYACFIIYSE